jgi:murein DD-endopeptidase MepM/ murein hydrolase activator NlpD
MQKIIGGDVKPPAPKAAPTPSGTAPTDPATQAQTDSIDAAFRRQFEQQAVEARTQRYAKTDEALKDLTFFAPLGGLIMNRFDVKRKHFAVDIVAKKDEPIKSVADGTVIISSWTQDSGHVIGIQHKNQILSFYKHNSVRLKEVGDVVRAGDIVAIIGNSGELTDGPHLHFELWHNGNPVNPEEYIRFSF